MKNHESDNVTSGSGFDTGSGDTGSIPSGNFGGKDKKKLFILLGLLAVGGAVGAYQFLGSGGPAQATAVTTSASGPGVASAATPTTAGAATAANKDETPVIEDELSVPRVEKLVKEFDGYVKARQVPLPQLNTSPFRTKPSRAAVKAAAAGGTGGTGAAPVSVVQEPKLRPREALPKLTLGSIMVAGDKRWAVINNKLCSVGSTVAGCRVEAIEADHVRLSRDGEMQEDLLLKPHASGRDTGDPDAN